MKERFDYGQNPDKTEGGELISSYGCDHMTADAEFLLSKAKYKAATGREQRRDADVLCYQIRQSFKPGEITPEEANRVGYETAMRWTKGKYAFFVATHTDRQHIHNHIYYNSTSLDCSHKFRDFIGSARAVRRLSDRICLENDLSVITNPKLHSKGRFLHYGAWLGTERKPSYKEQLRRAINEALAKRPADFDAFLRLMEASGFTVKHGRGGAISFLVPGQERATRLRASTLGDGYDPEDIKAVIAGERPIPEHSVLVPAAPRRVNLIVDIQERLRSGKGAVYAHRIVKRVRYICYGKTRKQTECDGQTGYTAHILDGIIDKVVRQIFERMKAIPKSEIVNIRYREKMEERKALLKSAKSDYAKAAAELDTLRAEVIKSLRGESAFPQDLLSSLISDCETKCLEVQHTMEAAQAAYDEGQAMLDALNAQYDDIISWADMYDSASMESKKMIVSCLIRRVEVYRDYRLHIDFNIDFEQFSAGLDISAIAA